MSWLLILLAPVLIQASSGPQTKGAQKSSAGSTPTFTKADVEGAVEKAQQLKSEGKYEQALQLHIWYHKNALKYDQAQAGVRLSYALSDWIDLGRVYPTALKALRSIRDETLATYKKHPTDYAMYEDVMSIDFELDDLHSAKSLFYLGRQNGMGSDLILELDEVVRSGDLKWASDIVGDPAKKLDEIKNEREMSMTALSGHKDLLAGEDDLFASQIENLLKAVAKIHGLPTARKIQKKALLFLNKPGIRNALIPSVTPPASGDL